jgi:hypothetical protein
MVRVVSICWVRRAKIGAGGELGDYSAFCAKFQQLPFSNVLFSFSLACVCVLIAFFHVLYTHFDGTHEPLSSRPQSAALRNTTPTTIRRHPIY